MTEHMMKDASSPFFSIVSKVMFVLSNKRFYS